MSDPLLIIIAAVIVSALLLVWQRRVMLRLLMGWVRRSRSRVVLDTDGPLRESTSQRLTVLSSSTVIKQQDPAVAVVEAEKTRRAGAIALSTGLFAVPRLIDYTPERGRIEFERIPGVEPLWSWLVGRRPQEACELAERVGRSLAAVHERLRLPLGLGESLPEPWRLEPGCVPGLSMTQDHEVALHGDFNAWNLLVSDRGRGLVIIDWAGSDLCSPLVVRGPWVFDAAWLIITLFRSRLGPVERIGQAEEFSRVFLESYGAGRRLPEAAAVCGAYLGSLMPVLRRPEIRGRREQWLRPKLDVARLSRFATGLCQQVPVRNAA
jgi:hypothetical protein